MRFSRNTILPSYTYILFKWYFIPLFAGKWVHVRYVRYVRYVRCRISSIIIPNHSHLLSEEGHCGASARHVRRLHGNHLVGFGQPGSILSTNLHCIYGGFLTWWYPTTIGFPTKNDHFGVFWGYHHSRKHLYRIEYY